jgi:predicted DNA-binding transcriptional regulator AlpA
MLARRVGLSTPYPHAPTFDQERRRQGACEREPDTDHHHGQGSRSKPDRRARGIRVLDATALSRRLGFKRDTLLAYLSRRNFRRIPRPYRQLAMGPIWYEKSVREWIAKEEARMRGK